MDVGFQLFQAQNMFHFFLTGNFSSAEAKWDGTQLSTTAFMHLEDDLDKAEEETGRIMLNKWTSVQFN